MIPQPGTPTAAVVPVATKWASKINWAAMISLFATVAAIWNIPLSPELQNNLVVGLLAVCALIDIMIMVFRTFFTKTVTVESVSGSPVVDQTKPVAAVTPPGEVVLVIKPSKDILTETTH